MVAPMNISSKPASITLVDMVVARQQQRKLLVKVEYNCLSELDKWW